MDENDFLIPLKGFKALEFNLYVVICNKILKEKSLTTVIDWEELKDSSNFNEKERQLKYFLNHLESLSDKMIDIKKREYIEDTGHIKIIVFTDFAISKSRKKIKVSINPKIKSVFWAISGVSANDNIEEFIHLKSIYSKLAYRILKRYKNKGQLKMQIDDFKKYLDVPDSYRMNDINIRVIKPIIKELTPLFPNLEVNKIKAKRQNKIESIEFKFDNK